MSCEGLSLDTEANLRTADDNVRRCKGRKTEAIVVVAVVVVVVVVISEDYSGGGIKTRSVT